MTPVAAGFLVEDFLEAITAQLDRTQDALRLKSVNRPLTYAIRDFSLELKVFVEMGPDGKVRFRAGGPNEDGASVVQIGFTTVTRPMIEESTVSLSAVRSPTLDELGLGEDERRGLERLGVRSASQLVQLGRATGERTVSRLSGLPVDRLRAALAHGRPSVRSIRPVAPDSPAAPAVPAPPVVTVTQPVPVASPHPPEPPVPPVIEGPGQPGPALGPDLPRAPSTIKVPAGTRRIHLGGPSLGDHVAAVRLGSRPLTLHPVADGVEVDLGDEAEAGTLAVELADEGVFAFALEFDAPPEPAGRDPEPSEAEPATGANAPGDDAPDPWRPE